MTILIGDSRVASIPVRDNGDPLVSLGDLAPTAVGAGGLARRSLALRLEAANDLLPAGIGLRVVEGFRTASAQQAIIGAYSRRLREERPGLEQAELGRLVSRYVAPLDNAPHVAGAAVDLTLVDPDGAELWMGSALDATPEESDGACFTAAPGLDALAQAHRALLVATLESVGLVNYPTEWWHWSFGDRYWAYVTRAPYARYGALTETAAA
ncbi:M15 family metallopeptidase [Aeromicrobium sp. 9AM]|uniref:M15 family metallopeptidase n=1 Tax=Aeromicrobium sp. 9AM TaxID=2653126 RepID=UPI0012F197B8|nr:M15 family metallopeptidase [Aeromicrobium sp. 9AM]VXB38237.1 D-alanyl-D-alanine dipeptidase [Aeromicrobium sp. 9AM]